MEKSRLEKLISLLEAKNSVVRRQAAQQIGDVARLHPSQLNSLLANLHRYIKSPSNWDARVAAASALKEILQAVFMTRNVNLDEKAFGQIIFDLRSILASDFRLVGSEGKEFDVAIADSSAGRMDRQAQRLRVAQQLGFLKPQINDVADIVTDEDLTYSSGDGIKMEPRSDVDEPTPPKLFKVEPSDNGCLNVGTDAEPRLVLVNFVQTLCADLYDPNWTTRHGATLALKEVASSPYYANLFSNSDVTQQKSSFSVADILRHAFNILAVDRFNDFVGDHVVAPVRETCAQVVAASLSSLRGKRMESDDTRVNSVVELVKNVFRICQSFLNANENSKQWECGHAGLLTVKYVIGALRQWPLLLREDYGLVDYLYSIFDLVVKNLDDSNDDMVIAAAQALLPLVDILNSKTPAKIQQAIEHCWNLLRKYVTTPSIELQHEVCSPSSHDPSFMIDHSTCDDDSAAEGLFQLLESSSQPLVIDDTRLLLLLPFISHSQPQLRQRLVAVLIRSAKYHSLNLSDSAWYKLVVITFYRSLIEDHYETSYRLAAELFPSLIELRTADTVWNMFRLTVGQWLACVMIPEHTSLNAVLGNVYHVESMKEGNTYLGGKDILTLNDKERDRVVIDARLRGARLLAILCNKLIEASVEDVDPEQCLIQLVSLYLHSNSAYQRAAICMLLREWSNVYPPDEKCNDKKNLFFDDMKKALENLLIITAQSAPSLMPTVYDEVILNASEIHAACRDFLSLANVNDSDGELQKVTPAAIISNVEAVEEACSKIFEKGIQLKTSTTTESELRNSHTQLKELIRRNSLQMSKINMRISFWIACAYIRLGGIPPKFNPVVQPLMNCLKNESNRVLAKEAATSLALLLESAPACVSSKIVKNLTVLHSSDPKQTPLVAGEPDNQILSWTAKSRGESSSVDTADSSGVSLMAQNAGLALKEIVGRFGEKLTTRFPQFYETLTIPLVAPKSSDPVEQNLINSMQTLETVYAALPTGIRDNVRHNQIPAMCDNFKHASSAVRHMACRCLVAMAEKDLASTLNVALVQCTELLSKNIHNDDSKFGELGANELLFSLVDKLNVNLIGIIPLLAVPVLTGMSSPESAIRPVASYTFGQLVKLMPLEVDDRPLAGLSQELIDLRRNRLEFLHLLSRPEALGRQVDGGDEKRNQMFNSVQINANLRFYQRDGIVWLRFLAQYGLHGILCDDMGLGKTLQTLTALAIGISDGEQKINRASLIVCPKTLTSHWLSEIKKFFPETLKPVCVFDRNTPIDISICNVVITSYDIFRKESVNGPAIETVFNYRWYYCILDEGHVIRNPKTRLFRALIQLKSDHRLILSGTPVQNSVLELWALFEFLMPGYLGTLSQFHTRFAKPILLSRDAKASSIEAESGQAALENLHKLVLPFILRRRKCDVLDDLPPKIIQDYPCQLSPLQNQLYEDFTRTVKDTFSSQASSSGSTKRTAGAFQILLYLRKLCDHPCLVLDEKHPNYGQIKADFTAGVFGSDYSNLDDVRLSGKMVALKQLLSECGIGRQAEAEDEEELQTTVSPHRALIFCQFKAVLTLIARYFDAGVFGQSIGYRRLDGSIPPTQRQSIVDEFNNDPSIDILLLSTQIGGLGLNLTGADVVIFVDHDWNPANDLQAMDRAHRIGQKRTVNVYRLITSGTLEEKMMRLQQFKTRTADTIIGEDNRSMMSMATDQLLDLLILDSGAAGAPSTLDNSATKQKKCRASGNRKNESGIGESTAVQGLDLPSLWDQSQYDEAFDYNTFIGTLLP